MNLAVFRKQLKSGRSVLDVVFYVSAHLDDVISFQGYDGMGFSIWLGLVFALTDYSLMSVPVSLSKTYTFICVNCFVKFENLLKRLQVSRNNGQIYRH